MAKKSIIESANVVIDPDGRYMSEQQIKALCDDIVSQVKRHVDGVAWCGTVINRKDICEFCGLEWEVNEDPDDPDFGLGEPICCVMAQEEWKDNKPVQQTVNRC